MYDGLPFLEVFFILQCLFKRIFDAYRLFV